MIGNIGTWWHIYMGNEGTIWWETSAHEVTINMGNFVRKGTMQWETLAHEGYTDMRDTLARETCSHDGHTLGTLTLAQDGHILGTLTLATLHTMATRDGQHGYMGESRNILPWHPVGNIGTRWHIDMGNLAHGGTMRRAT